MAWKAALQRSAPGMGRRLSWLACIALLAAPAPLARAQETEPSPATPVLEVRRAKDALAMAKEAPRGPAASRCKDSRTCAERLGYGNVCESGQCDPYFDRTDIMGC